MFNMKQHFFVKTIVMFTGELDYTDIPMQHWLGQLLFLIFIFLIVVVIMNLLNGLAVSDIQKIYKVTPFYYHGSVSRLSPPDSDF